MQRLADAMLEQGREQLTKASLQRICRSIEASFGDTKVVDGAFIRDARRGKHPLKNPTDARVHGR